MSQNRYAFICLHESAHCVVAIALGVKVSRVAAEQRGDGVAGEAYLTLPDDPCHATAILLAGVNSVNAFGHIAIESTDAPLSKPPNAAIPRDNQRQPAESKVSCETWHAGRAPMAPGRDGGRIRDILSGKPDAMRIFGEADRLSLRILDENSRVLMILTARLATAGELEFADFQDLSARIIPAKLEPV